MIAAALARTGIDVCIICDGPQRHHSKMASVDRQASQELKRIRAIHARMEKKGTASSNIQQTTLNDGYISTKTTTPRSRGVVDREVGQERKRRSGRTIEARK
jgi:hypothetical protein